MKKSWVAILLLSYSSLGLAADVTTLQAALEMARQNMETAKSKYMDARMRVAYQEKTVARIKASLDKEQKQLLDDRKNLDAAQKGYYSAKEKHDRAQAILDKAWSNH